MDKFESVIFTVTAHLTHDTIALFICTCDDCRGTEVRR